MNNISIHEGLDIAVRRVEGSADMPPRPLAAVRIVGKLPALAVRPAARIHSYSLAAAALLAVAVAAYWAVEAELPRGQMPPTAIRTPILPNKPIPCRSEWN